MLAEVTGFDLDLARGACSTTSPSGDEPDASIPYDTLIVAGGSRYSYFGHDEWREHAPELKSLAGALDIRSRDPGGVRGGRGRARSPTGAGAG